MSYRPAVHRTWDHRRAGSPRSSASASTPAAGSGTKTWRMDAPLPRSSCAPARARARDRSRAQDGPEPWMTAMLTALTAPIVFTFTYRILPRSSRRRPAGARGATVERGPAIARHRMIADARSHDARGSRREAGRAGVEVAASAALPGHEAAIDRRDTRSPRPRWPAARTCGLEPSITGPSSFGFCGPARRSRTVRRRPHCGVHRLRQTHVPPQRRSHRPPAHRSGDQLPQLRNRQAQPGRRGLRGDADDPAPAAWSRSPTTPTRWSGGVSHRKAAAPPSAPRRLPGAGVRQERKRQRELTDRLRPLTGASRTTTATRTRSAPHRCDHTARLRGGSTLTKRASRACRAGASLARYQVPLAGHPVGVIVFAMGGRLSLDSVTGGRLRSCAPLLVWAPRGEARASRGGRGRGLANARAEPRDRRAQPWSGTWRLFLAAVFRGAGYLPRRWSESRHSAEASFTRERGGRSAKTLREARSA